jgi:hypothetical protein
MYKAFGIYVIIYVLFSFHCELIDYLHVAIEEGTTVSLLRKCKV